ncbi:MAG TPA: hypothetical protein VGB53_13825, partial [Rubricoccaceae bacterium]
MPHSTLWRPLVLPLFALVLTASAGAQTATFSNTTPIQLTQGTQTAPFPGNPYPSTVAVTGMTGVVTDVNVTVRGITHTWASDIDVLLVAPNGASIVLFSDVIGNFRVANRTYTFDDAGGTPLSLAA